MRRGGRIDKVAYFGTLRHVGLRHTCDLQGVGLGGRRGLGQEVEIVVDGAGVRVGAVVEHHGLVGLCVVSTLSEREIERAAYVKQSRDVPRCT